MIYVAGRFEEEEVTPCDDKGEQASCSEPSVPSQSKACSAGKEQVREMTHVWWWERDDMRQRPAKTRLQPARISKEIVELSACGERITLEGHRGSEESSKCAERWRLHAL